MPKRTSLPSMLPPDEPQRIKRRGAVGFGPIGDGDAGNKQHAHDGEDRPALPLIADHAAEHVGQRRADREDRQHLHEIGQRRRILERMGRIGVEEAAAIGAEHLDRDLRRHGANRDGLLGAFERRRLDIGAERLRHALPDQEQRVDDADRQQHIERACGSHRPRNCRRSAPRRAKSRGSGRPPAQCRSQPTGNSDASAPASARDRTACSRHRSSASWCW